MLISESDVKTDFNRYKRSINGTDFIFSIRGNFIGVQKEGSDAFFNHRELAALMDLNYEEIDSPKVYTTVQAILEAILTSYTDKDKVISIGNKNYLYIPASDNTIEVLFDIDANKAVAIPRSLRTLLDSFNAKKRDADGNKNDTQGLTEEENRQRSEDAVKEAFSDQLKRIFGDDVQFLTDYEINQRAAELQSEADDDVPFQIIGVKGASSMDSAEEATTRMDNLAIAKEMEQSGKEPLAIKQATGWEKGADGKWRYETPDVTLKKDSFGEYEIKSFVGNDKNHPITRDLSEVVDLSNLPPNYRDELEYVGEIRVFDDYTEALRGSYITQGDKVIFTINLGATEDPNSILAHEIQHFIQDREGFSRGGNEKVASNTHTAKRERAPFERYLNDMNNISKEIARQYKKEEVQIDEDKTLSVKEKKKKKRDLYKQIENRIFSKMKEKIIQDAKDAGIMGKYGLRPMPDDFSFYRRLAGEVEARAVQRRINLSMEERRNSLFTDEMYKDVAKEDLIFLEDGLSSNANDDGTRTPRHIPIESKSNNVIQFQIGNSNQQTGEVAEEDNLTSDEKFVRDYEKYSNEKASEELENILIALCDKLNIEINRQDIKDKFGIGIQGAFDVYNKIIYLAEGHDKLTLPEEFAHGFIKMMGASKNKTIRQLIEHIKKTDVYKKLYDEYNLIYADDKKVQEEALGQVLAVALVRSYETEDYKKETQQEVEQISENDKGIFDKIIEWFKNFLHSVKKNAVLNTFNFEDELAKIANDILSGRLDNLQKVEGEENFIEQNYEDTIKEQNARDGGIALQLMKDISDLNGIITGSIAYRAQGSVFRKNNGDLHDIDVILPLESTMTDYADKDHIKLAGGNLNISLMYDLQKTKFFQEFFKKYKDVQMGIPFVSRNGKITWSGAWSPNPEIAKKFMRLEGNYQARMDQMDPEEVKQLYVLDFFIEKSNEDHHLAFIEPKHNLRLAKFPKIYEAKLGFGRAKDLMDYRRWKVYKGQNVDENSDVFLKTTRNIQAFSKSNNEIYGFAHNGKIVLNKDKFRPDTPVHEYTHLWDEALMRMAETNEAAKALWERGIELMRKTKVWQEVINDPNYANIRDDVNEVASEVHSRLSGMLAAGKAIELAMEDESEDKGSWWDRLIEWFNQFKDFTLQTIFGLSKEYCSQVTLEQFVNAPVSDFLMGTDPRAIRASEVTGSQEQIKATDIQPATTSQTEQNPSPAPEQQNEQIEDEIVESSNKRRPIAKRSIGNNSTDENLNAFTPEMEDIKSKAVADGTFMKAPNGKPTNLNERQWLQVRTRAFKDWFGDWEKTAKAVEIIEGSKDHGFNNFDEAKKWAKENIVGEYNQKEIGSVRISGTAIDKYLSQKAVDKSDNKDVHLSALKQMPQIIENSMVGEIHGDRDDNTNIKDIVRLFSAINIGGKNYRVKTTVKRYNDAKTKSKAYSYEVTEIELLEGLNEASHTQSADSTSTSNNSITGANLLNGVVNSKGEPLLNHSKVVDENGEPLVVYNASPVSVTTYKDGINFFSSDKEYVKSRKAVDPYTGEEVEVGYGGNVNAVFLNIRNPQMRSFDDGLNTAMANQILEKNPDADGIIGHDTVFNENIDLDWYSNGTEYVTKNPNQIKSAADNVGTFSKKSNHIRYSKSINLDTVLSPNANVLLSSKKFVNDTLNDFNSAGQLKALVDVIQDASAEETKSNILNLLRTVANSRKNMGGVRLSEMTDSELLDQYLETSFGESFDTVFKNIQEMLEMFESPDFTVQRLQTA